MIAVPYENALSAYAGNCFFVAADGESGMIEPLPDSSPIQSCAPTMTSGAVSTATVETSWRIGPDCFWTTWTVTPLLAAQALATFVTAGTRSASAQMTIFADWLVADVPVDTATTATSALTARPAATRSLRVLNIEMPSLRNE